MRTFKLVICLFLVFAFCFSLLALPSLASEFSYVWSDTAETSANITNENIINNTNTKQDVNNTANITNTNVTNNSTITENVVEETNSEVTDDNFLGLNCGSAILIEQSTGQVLYAYNIHEQLHPASVTKIMSILLIMESLDSGKISLDDQVPCSENAH